MFKIIFFLFSINLCAQESALFQLFEKLNEVNSNLSFDQQQIISIQGPDGKILIPYLNLSYLLDEEMMSIQNAMEESCQCKLPMLKTHYLKNRAAILDKTINAINRSKTFFSELLYNEVEGLRRYGLLYVLINLSFEVLEHHISPIPLCKAVLVLSKTSSLFIKNSFLHLFPFFTQLTYSESTKLLYFKVYYKFVWEKKMQSFFDSISNNEKGMVRKWLDKLKQDSIAKQLRSYPSNPLNNEHSKIDIPLMRLSPMEKFLVLKQQSKAIELQYEIAKNILENEAEILNTKRRIAYYWKLGAIGEKIDRWNNLLFHLLLDTSEEKIPYLKQEKVEILKSINEFMIKFNVEMKQFQCLEQLKKFNP